MAGLGPTATSVLAQGALTNGWMHTGTISPAGASDSWTFDAVAGESIVVRVGEITQTGAFSPRIRLINPSAVQQATSTTTVGAEVAVTATNSGTFTVVVEDNLGTSATGTYRLTLAKSPGVVFVAPGDEGGPMTNGVMHTGTIDVGDLDLWTVEATIGESIVVRMGETNTATFSPHLRIYGPSGALLHEAATTVGAEVAVTATNNGTFLIVAGDFTGSWSGSGSYRLTLAKTGDPVVVSAGDDGGPMTNGVMHTGTIDVGDLDLWTVTAAVGQSLVVRMGEASNAVFSPQLRIYNFNGTLLQSSFSTVGAEVAVTATSGGTFLIVAGDATGSWQGTGPYRITLARTGDPVVISAGDEGGPMTNGVMHTGTIDVGDLDLWTVTATAGDAIVVRMGETNTATFSPQLRLYSPESVLVDTAYSTVGAEVAVTAGSSGTFLIVAGDFTGSWQGTGSYRITLARTGDPVMVSLGDEGGPMTGASSYNGAISVGDLDVFTFTACAGDSIVLKMDEAVSLSPLTPQLRLYGRDGTLLNAISGPATAQISRNAPASGEYLLVAGDFTGSWSGSGDYTLTVNGLAEGFKLCSPAISGPSLNVSAVGGVAGANGVLYTHTNVASPVTNWTPIVTNEFDAFGVWVYTNLFNPSELQRYFILRSD